MMKIVFIVPSLSGGGAQRVVSVLANRLSEEGNQVVIALVKKNKSEYTLDERVVCEANPYGRRVWAQLRFLRHLMKKYKGSVFVSFATYQNMYALLAGIGMRQRIVVSERCAPAYTLDGRAYLEPLRRWLYQRAEAVVFQTEEARRFFPEKVRKKGILIENPLKVDLPEPYHGEREKRFVAFSRLDEQKNIPMMLDAFRIFLKTHPGYVLSIYGRGDIRGQLEAYARDLHLENSVEFCGFCEDIHVRVRSSMAFLSSSDYEGISNSMLESMAIGIPCICTDCPAGGAAMYIRHGINGFLVPVGDSEKMAECMGLLAEDRQLVQRISAASVKIREQLSVDRILKKWEELFAAQSSGR